MYSQYLYEPGHHFQHTEPGSKKKKKSTINKLAGAALKNIAIFYGLQIIDDGLDNVSGGNNHIGVDAIPGGDKKTQPKQTPPKQTKKKPETKKKNKK